MQKILTRICLGLLVGFGALVGFVGVAGAQSADDVYSGIGDGLDEAALDGAVFTGTRVVPAFIIIALVSTAIGVGRKMWKKHGPEKA